MLKNIRLLYIHNLFVDFRFQAAFLTIYFAQITGSYAMAMAVSSAATLTAALADIPTGVLSDKMGRKFTLVLASVFSTAGSALWAFSNSGGGLFLGAVFCGLSQCLFNGNNDALLYESLKSAGQEGQFHHYQGRTSSMFQLALGLSALCASFLTSYGLRLVFIFGIIPQALSVIVGLFFEEPKVHVPTTEKSFAHFKTAFVKIYKNPRLLLLIVAQAISHGADDAKFLFQTAYINTLWPMWAVGIYRAVNHGLGFLGFWFAGTLVDRFREAYVLVAQQAYWLVSQTLGLILSNVATPAIFLTDGVLYGPGVVARDSLLQKEFTDEQRATMGSVASFTSGLVFAVIGLGIGAISDRFGLAAGVGFSIFAGAVSFPAYIWLFRKDF
jgi:MFS family permease